MRERHTKDARKRRAKATHTGKGLVHFGGQVSLNLHLKMTPASHNPEVVFVVGWV